MSLPIIEVENLNFSYGKRQVLNVVSFSLEKNKILALIGPNGSGKSTLLRCLAGINPISHGIVRLAGEDLFSYKRKNLARTLSFMPQFQESLSGITVHEVVKIGRSPYHSSGWRITEEDTEYIEWALDYMHINDFRSRPVNELSGGERQRVWIAMVLAQNTPLIFLDEPASFMDLRHQRDLLALIHDLKTNHGKTIIAVLHDINHAVEISDSVCLLENGRVNKFGSVNDVITENSIKNVYGVRTHICRLAQCKKPVVVPENIQQHRYSAAACAIACKNTCPKRSLKKAVSAIKIV